MNFSNKNGQLTTHYVALIILVVSALTIMFPVVRNSIYGYFKSLEESIEDSESDVNLKAPPDINPNLCHCLAFQRTQLCGGYDEPRGNPPFTLRCQIGFRYWFKPCPNCTPEQIRKLKINQHDCRPDPTCCSKPIPSCNVLGSAPNCCGANVTNYPGGNWQYPPERWPPDDSCRDAFAHTTKRCGSPPVTQLGGCISNLNCAFSCPTTWPANTIPCNPTGQRLTQRNTPWTVVPLWNWGTEHGGCNAYCPPPFHIEGNECKALCPAGQMYSYGCPPGQCARQNCAQGWCKR